MLLLRFIKKIIKNKNTRNEKKILIDTIISNINEFYENFLPTGWKFRWKFFNENNLAKLIHIIRNIDIPIIIKDGWSKEWSLEKENASSGWFFGWFLMNFSEKKIFCFTQIISEHTKRVNIDYFIWKAKLMLKLDKDSTR